MSQSKLLLEPNAFGTKVLTHCSDGEVLVKFDLSDYSQIEEKVSQLQKEIDAIKQERENVLIELNKRIEPLSSLRVSKASELDTVKKELTDLLNASELEDVKERCSQLIEHNTKVKKDYDLIDVELGKVLSEREERFKAFDGQLELKKDEIGILRKSQRSIEEVGTMVRSVLRDSGVTSWRYLDKNTLAFPLSYTNATNALKASERLSAFVTPNLYNYVVRTYEDAELARKGYENIRSLDLEDPPFLAEGLVKTTPYKHQKIGLVFADNLEHSALFWEMGTGKTATILALTKLRMQRKQVERTLVICPLSVIMNWKHEVVKHTDLTCEVLIGSKKSKLYNLYRNADIYITNYEAIGVLEDELVSYLGAFKTQVIVDESSKIKNIHTKRSRAIIKLGSIAKYRHLLTGTPVTQHAHDLFPQFLFLDHGETFGANYDNFLDKYFLKKGFGWTPRYTALEQISDKVFRKATRFLKKDCLDLPPKSYQTRVVEMQPTQLKIYKEMAANAIAEIESDRNVVAPIVLVQLLRLSQITSGFVKIRELDIEQTIEGGNPKLDALGDIMSEVGSQSVVVWCRFKHDIEAVSKYLSTFEVENERLYGETPLKERDRIVTEFQEGKFKVLVGNQQTAGFGINLTAASVSVFFSNDYSLSNRLQAEDRLHRIGQANPVTYIDIVCNGSIDLLILEVLKAKKNVADIITKDLKRWLSEALNGNLTSFLRGIIEKL